MYEFIKGKIIEKTPTYTVVEASGIGYRLEISLNTHQSIKDLDETLLYIHFVVREDAQFFFGFASKGEREIFRLLISVSGIGANTARIVLSYLSAAEVKNAIQTDNVNLLKSVKGIGAKTAQKAIIELKDKIDKAETGEFHNSIPDNTIKTEALSALVMLGYIKNTASKVVDKILKDNPGASVEETVKSALKLL